MVSAGGEGAAIGATGALRPQTSMAHSSTAGPGRPLAIARIAAATSGAASPGSRMRAEKSTRREMMPAWSRISCRCPSPRPIEDCLIWPIKPSTGAFMP